jgi:hypothetical protein
LVSPRFHLSATLHYTLPWSNLFLDPPIPFSPSTVLLSGPLSHVAIHQVSVWWYLLVSKACDQRDL